jgi:hypothetical protein
MIVPSTPNQKNPLSTDYFDEKTVRDGVSGCCHDFALAVHRRTGWRIGVLWHTWPKPEKPYDLYFSPLVSHVFCVAPDGRAVDVEGVFEIDALIKRWARDERDLKRLSVVYHDDQASYDASLEKAESAENQRMMGRDFRIEAAESVIAKSAAFLELLASLQEQAPRPAA